MNDNVFTCYSSCHKCNRRIKIQYFEDTCETRENVTFLGRLGTETYSYCPYCGVKQTGFMPYDTQPESTNALPDDEDGEEWNDEAESWWPDAEGVTLVDEEDEEDDGDSNPWEMDDESVLEEFTCPSCRQHFRLNPKEIEKIYCYFCGKEAEKA